MQEHIESITAVALAVFQRRRLREARDEEAAASIDRATIGLRREASLLYAITNRREIAGPLAALYVQRGSCAFISSPCATLSLRAVLNELVQQVPHSCDLVELRGCDSDITFRAASSLDDYSYRPPGLDHLNLYEYVARHFRRKRTRTASHLALFQSDHPRFETHCVGTHIDEVVPVVVGMRMPFVNDASPHEVVVKRSKCALVLFKPFRGVSDLVADPTNDEKWIEAFVQWEPTRSGFCREIMANMDDYQRAAMQAQECIANAEPTADKDADSDSGEFTGTRENIDAILDRAASSDPTDVAAAEADAFCPMLDEFELELDGESTGDVSTFACTLPVFPNSDSSVTRDGYRGLLGVAAHSTASTNADLRSRGATLELPLDELRHFVNDTTNDEAEPQRSQQYRNERPTEVIELIIDALEGSADWSPQSLSVQQSVPPIRPYASMQDISRAFTLNERQHAAFTLIATSLLQRFLRQELDGLHGGDDGSYSTANFESNFREDQLLMFLGGPGGTGKSRVIDAVDAFCLSWCRDDSVVKTALTGKAATLISGRTLASFLMRIKHAFKEKRFLPLDLLVIDEVSMLSKVEFLRLDKLLRRYTQVLNVPFGGVHVVLVGDFLQMPPVNADPIYIDPADKIRASTADIEGFELWRRFSTVVILEESVRFRRDPQWGDGCRHARLGQWTPDFIALINSRVLTRRDNGANASTPSSADATQAAPLQIDAGAVFVTPENATRLAINNAFVSETAAMLPTDTYPVRVVANFKGALNGLSHSDTRYVLSLPDSKLGRVAPYLDLIDGMLVQVTQNAAAGKGIANGTLGTLEYVHFPNGTHFRLVRDSASSTIVQLPSCAPASDSHPPRARSRAVSGLFRHRGVQEGNDHITKGAERPAARNYGQAAAAAVRVRGGIDGI